MFGGPWGEGALREVRASLPPRTRQVLVDPRRPLDDSSDEDSDYRYRRGPPRYRQAEDLDSNASQRS